MSSVAKREAPKIPYGLINLSARDGSLFKETLICHTGVWKGVWGPIEITAEWLQRIADKYNKARAKPLNQNDFAPILINHNRDVELVKGRVLADLVVSDWTDSDTGTLGKGLFGTLRVDNPDAQAKVDSGQYAQVSMSFDEDDDTLWEVSFVAVEAARRSQAFEQGDSQMSVELQGKLDKANKGIRSLKAHVRESLTVRKAAVLAAGDNLKAAQTELGNVISQLESGLKESKTALLKSQFRGLIRTGQLSKAEYDKLEFPKLSAMTADSISMLLGSYRSRPVSPHVAQFGQTGAQPRTGSLSAADMRAARAAQLAGKGGKAALKVEEPTGDGGQGDKGKEAQKEFAESDKEGADEFEQAIKKMGEIEPVVGKAKEFLGKMSESLKRLGEQNEKDEKDDEVDECH